MADSIREVELTPRQLYRLGQEGAVRVYGPQQTPGYSIGEEVHVAGTDVFVKASYSGVIKPSAISLSDLMDAGFLTEIPFICKEFEPTTAQKLAYSQLSDEKREEFLQTRAKHTYMGWCGVADKLFPRFEKDWKERYPEDDSIHQEDGWVRRTHFTFSRLG